MPKNLSYKPFQYDLATVKDYGGKGAKLTLLKCVRTKGIEETGSRPPPAPGSVNDDKLECNISRARSKVFELALCNEWQYFSTFTIDGKKFGRYDLEAYHKAFAQWLRDCRKKGICIRYLIIPEQHKDGAWHEHGLISGIPLEYLRLFDPETERLPKYIRDKLFDGQAIYDWPAYRSKFGFCDFEPVRSVEAVSKYVTKYITKDLARSVTDIGAHMYYATQGLQRAEVIKKGFLSDTEETLRWDFSNDYVRTIWRSGVGAIDALSHMIAD